MHCQARQNNPALITNGSDSEFSQQSISSHSYASQQRAGKRTPVRHSGNIGEQWRLQTQKLFCHPKHHAAEINIQIKGAGKFPFEPRAPSRQSKLWSFGFRNEKLSQLKPHRCALCKRRRLFMHGL
ncbi:hypothetical protein CEXT_752671 [Caerostris extrusa]|uniref:Uncharacterized protein n=1 Tax=Caerostris extrusa TaxID=172846 RepID=A0AAV4PYD5_CAEEX|nr:hypothetical protein CEXT_752671 [Caerostris extrusa]